MYELIKRLRELASIPEHCENVADCDQCSKEDICLSFTNKRIIETATKAADAIEELSAKATPKRVGFTGWKGCRDTRYKCPHCKKYVRNDEAYCHKCGQALMFPSISHTPYVPGEKQEVIVTWPDEPQREK